MYVSERLGDKRVEKHNVPACPNNHFTAVLRLTKFVPPIDIIYSVTIHILLDTSTEICNINSRLDSYYPFLGLQRDEWA